MFGIQLNQFTPQELLWLSVSGLFVLGFIARFLMSKVLIGLLEAAAKRTKSIWDDELIAAKVFSRLATIALPIVIYIGLGFFYENVAPTSPIE
ncbi:MAG: hypothetical protein HN961_01565, partial [Planctomycetes bacterium]|nr:hypothetical protein [Planctomycetota bacterium]